MLNNSSSSSNSNDQSNFWANFIIQLLVGVVIAFATAYFTYYVIEKDQFDFEKKKASIELIANLSDLKPNVDISCTYTYDPKREHEYIVICFLKNNGKFGAQVSFDANNKKHELTGIQEGKRKSGKNGEYFEIKILEPTDNSDKAQFNILPGGGGRVMTFRLMNSSKDQPNKSSKLPDNEFSSYIQKGQLNLIFEISTDSEVIGLYKRISGSDSDINKLVDTLSSFSYNHRNFKLTN